MLKHLKDVESELGLVPTATGARVDQGRLHAYGALQVEHRRKEFKATAGKVRSVLQMYQNWIGNEREVDVSRYLTLVHDENTRKAQLDGTKKRLAGCQQLITRHLKTMRTVEAKPEADTTIPAAAGASSGAGAASPAAAAAAAPGALVVGPKLLVRLNKMARQFNMQCDVFEAEKKWSTWTDDFLVDVSHFDSAARVQAVFQRVDTTWDAAISEQLTSVLRTGTKPFQAALRHLVRLFELMRSHPTANLIQIERQQLPVVITEALAGQPQYRAEASLEGCRVSYYSSPAAPHTPTHTAVLSLDEALPGAPKADQLPDDLCYQLHLQPRVPFAAAAFTLLINVLTDRPAVVPSTTAAREGTYFAALTDLIVAREEREHELDVLGDTHNYIDGTATRGVLVERIPAFRLHQVPFVLRVLRQQAVFNTLVASCYPTASVLLPAAQSAASAYTAVELYMDAPRSLKVATFLPSADGPKVSLEINVALGGDLSCQLLLADGTPADVAARFHSKQYLTRALQLSHSIPLTLHYALRKGT